MVDGKIALLNRRFSYEDTTFSKCNGTHGGKIELVDPVMENCCKITELAIKSVSMLGLQIGGVDLIEDDSGNVFVLEVNPEPDATFNGDAPDKSLPHAIASLLIKVARDNNLLRHHS